MEINRQSLGRPVGSAGRACLLGLALLLACGFGLALRLKPDPRGFGTHQQLGLPPCTAQLFFRIPCPGCGMTTSFAHFVRGELQQAAQANAAGLILATVCALMIPWCLGSAGQGRLLLVTSPWEVAGAGAASLGGLTLLLWFVRLAMVK